MSNTIHIVDNMADIKVPMQGKIAWRSLDKDMKVVEEYSHSNNILLQIRQPILKLLGAFGNIELAYNLNNAGWLKVPDTYKLLGVNGDIGLQVVPTTLPYIARIAFGGSDQPATVNDTDLVDPIAGADKILATSPTFTPDGLQVTFSILVDMNELNNVEMKEAVLRTVDGTAVARAPIGYYKKIPGMYWEFMWTIGYSNAV